MKKSTIILLLIVFLGSVIIVGVFGMQSVPFEEIVYVKNIVPTSVSTFDGDRLTIRQREGYYYVVVDFQQGLTLYINTRVEPADSTNKELSVTIVNNNAANPIAKIGDDGGIVILRSGDVHLHFSPRDSATAKGMDFWIYA